MDRDKISTKTRGKIGSAVIMHPHHVMIKLHIDYYAFHLCLKKVDVTPSTKMEFYMTKKITDW